MDGSNNNSESIGRRLTELELEKDIADTINEELAEKVIKLEEAKKILELKILRDSKSTRELLQEKEILNELNNILSEKESKLQSIKKSQF